MEDLRPKPKTLAKRKASPDCLGETQSQKKTKQTENASQDLADTILTTVAATEKPQEALSPTQKNYLTKKLATLQERKFAAEVLSSGKSDSDEISTNSAPMDLNKMMAKLLENKYTSATAFRDDMNLVVGTPNSGKNKKVLDHVNKFMEKLPKSQRLESKTNDDVEGDSAANITRKLHPGQSAAQEKETRYAIRQVEAFRKGTQSNQGKRLRDLVLEKARYLEAEERKKKAKQAEEKQRLERTARLMTIVRQNDRTIIDEVEAEEARDNGISGAEKVDRHSVDSMEDLEGEKTHDDSFNGITEEQEDEEAQDDHTDGEIADAANREDGEVQENHKNLTIGEHIVSDGKVARLIDVPSYKRIS